MSTPQSRNGNEDAMRPPLLRDADGRIDLDSVPDVIQWFLDCDQRVALIRHPRVEEVFQWKQEHSRLAGEDVFRFNRAEDRLAIGIIQALAEHATERTLHQWISQLLSALDSASKANESITDSYDMDIANAASIVSEADKIPFERGREDFLLNCWIESLCTAEARVLGWLYQEFYARPFVP